MHIRDFSFQKSLKLFFFSLKSVHVYKQKTPSSNTDINKTCLTSVKFYAAPGMGVCCVWKEKKTGVQYRAMAPRGRPQ